MSPLMATTLNIILHKKRKFSQNKQKGTPTLGPLVATFLQSLIEGDDEDEVKGNKKEVIYGIGLDIILHRTTTNLIKIIWFIAR